MIENLRGGAFYAFFIGAIIILLAHLFPSMRGPRWQENDLLIAVVLALLAIALKK